MSFRKLSYKMIAVAAFCGYGIGMYAQPKLNANNIDEVINAMTIEEKCHLVLGCGMNFNDYAKFPGTAGSSYGIPRLGIPATYCADSQQGLRMDAHRSWDHRDYYPTDFVASMTLASTWDREAAFKVGKGIGNEVREFGLDWILSPSMNLIRSALCGRNHEYYSEDPYLSGTIAAGYVNGVQSEGTAACPKHFIANNQETNRNNNNSQVSQRALREIYLKAFEIMVKESNPWTIMTSYNKLNGPYALQNEELLNTIPQASGVAQRGQKIISRGTLVDEQTYMLLESYVKESERRYAADSKLNITYFGELLYVLLLVVAFTVYLAMFRRDYFDHLPSLGLFYSLIVLFSVLASLLVSHNLLHVYILPVAMAPIFVRVFMDSRTAFMLHVVIVLIVASVLMRPFDFIAVEVMAGLAAIYSMRELSSRSQLFWTAALTTVAALLMNFAIYMIQEDDLTRIDASEFNYLIVAGILLFCSYPLLYIMERLFGFTSDITLIELSDMNKPLLRRMSEVAPGTFQHSIQVGNLAAEIARKVGANPLLVRTGALYHDIGKTQNPIYFTENQSGGINPHEQLSCIDSAQMIISHVTEGLKLADKHNLPDVIKNFISTHHGQGKAKYFYVKWKNDHPDEEIDDLLFTYPGPNPFTKEQAVLMMADAVEAASRSLPDYTEQSIRDLVTRIIDTQVSEGYFRECPITFRDIQYSKTVLIEKLKTIYHTRISYPELKKEEVQS